jgi:hypothetical protein
MLMYVYPGGANIDGFYVYPYYVTVDGGTPMQMMCDDFTDEISGGESWYAYANTLTQDNQGNLANASQFLFDKSTSIYGAGSTTQAPTTAVRAYDEAAYIFTDMSAGTISATEGNLAVWYLFSPSAAPVDATALGILNQANIFVRAHPGQDYSYITVYSPTPDGAISPSNAGRAQEFFAINSGVSVTPLSAVPEPPPSLLLAVGGALIGLVGLVRRKRFARP